MDKRKQLLSSLIDIGGVATLNNLYSPEAKTFCGSLLYTRKLFKSMCVDGLLYRIDTIGRPMNKAREVFYCVTKKGADYAGRAEEYKFKKYPKSPHNVMHESMKFDVALAFLGLYPFCRFTIRYDSSFYGVRPDILIRYEGNTSRDPTGYFLVEIERKKTVDRVFHEKIKRYEQMFKAIEKNKSHNPSRFTVLFIYADIFQDIYVRPQQYNEPNVILHLERVTNLVRQLVFRYCKYLPAERYRFLPFHDFYRLHEPLWYTPSGNKVPLKL